MEEQERFAIKIRAAGEQMREAEEEISRAEAMEKMTYAKAMVEAEVKGNKTAAAQMRFADERGDVYNARLNKGVAKGMLAAAKAEFRACEIEFEQWRSERANNRMEQRAYRG
jgi:hypothetical protein